MGRDRTEQGEEQGLEGGSIGSSSAAAILPLFHDDLIS